MLAAAETISAALFNFIRRLEQTRPAALSLIELARGGNAR
jgi:hypothetical protein